MSSLSLKLDCRVLKPNKAGSSFGISKVYTKEAILPAIAVAFKEDTEILIESFLEGTEVSVGIISFEGATKVLPITEIVSENDFFDYEAKYNGKSEEITPARITEKQEEKVNKAATKVYEILNISKQTNYEKNKYNFIYFFKLCDIHRL